MNIGILTFWQTKDNYGQMLQNFALQQKLRMLGHHPFLIRYAHSEARQTHTEDIVMNLLRRIKHWDFKTHKPLLFTTSEKDKQRMFEQFKDKHLEKTPRIYYSLKELQNSPPKADIYIVGSDQVWAKFLYVKENEVFFLNFGLPETVRLSYSASFGCTTYPDKIKNRLRKNLKRFQAISVREETGKRIIEDVGMNAKVVIDPTLLLKSSEYISYFNLSNKINKKDRIYIYSVNINSPEEIGWQELQKELNYDTSNVVITPSSGYVDSAELFGKNVNYKYPTIEEWIDYIRTSKMVITPSFHGIVFCLIFHTPFIYIPLGGKMSSGNNRVLDLFHNLNIEDKIYSDKRTYHVLLTENNLNWIDIDRRLESLRMESISFLDKYIK